jgi:two-component system response regulator FixJ
MEESHVYVVDDDPSVRSSMRFLLRSHALDCRTFEDGAALLKAFDALDPGCILLDMRLPGRSGIEVQAELARRGSRMPVIVMTATSNKEEAERSRAMGAIDVLEKPFEESALLAALDAGFEALEKEGQH